MSQDIRPILAGWEFDPDRVQVRIIAGDDGPEKIQMRIDLGLMQMEVERPARRRAAAGLRVAAGVLRGREHAGGRRGRRRSRSGRKSARCLMREGLQYYHRYLSAFHLERYDWSRGTPRGTSDSSPSSVKHAVRQRDRIEFDRYRPYVEMMHHRARASQALRAGRSPRGARARSTTGIKAIRRFLADYRQEDHEGECSELQFLLQWRQGARTRAADRAARAAGAATRGLGEARGLRGSGAAPRPDPAAPGGRSPRASAARAPPDRCLHPAARRSDRDGSRMPS